MKHYNELRELYAAINPDYDLLCEEMLKQVSSWLMTKVVGLGAVVGVLFALIMIYQPLLRDLSNCDTRDPFNLQEEWLLWAIIGVIVADTATFGTPFVTAYFSKRRHQPKTNASIDTGHEQYQLTVSPKVSILMWLAMAALLLPPMVEEYVHWGYPMALLTEWLATTIVVVISSFILAHWYSKQLCRLFVAVLAFGLTYAKTRNLMTSIAMHVLLIMVRCSVTFLPGRTSLLESSDIKKKRRKKKKT